MSEPVAFQGRILVDGHTALETSPYAETGWDNMSPTVPAQNPAAISKTGWDNHTDNAEEQVIAGYIVRNNWK